MCLFFLLTGAGGGLTHGGERAYERDWTLYRELAKDWEQERNDLVFQRDRNRSLRESMGKTPLPQRPAPRRFSPGTGSRRVQGEHQGVRGAQRTPTHSTSRARRQQGQQPRRAATGQPDLNQQRQARQNEQAAARAEESRRRRAALAAERQRKQEAEAEKRRQEELARQEEIRRAEEEERIRQERRARILGDERDDKGQVIDRDLEGLFN